MRTFDSLEVRRPQLARSYLQLLRAQPGRPIALFAPRRVGKTFFLDHDLTPEARAAGIVPVYADVWLHKSAPLEAINHALEEALDDSRVPATSSGKLARTAVKKLGGFGASIELGEAPARRQLPAQAELRLDALIGRLASATRKSILLMLDEIQALGELARGEATIATLRAVLQRNRRRVFAVFTGSSQESLSAMMSAAGGPMYQFAQLLDFPVLGEEYLNLLAGHFSRIHKNKGIDVAELSRVFERVGHKPALMKDLVKSMSAEGTTDVNLALKRMMADDRQVAGWRGLLTSVQPFERALLVLVAQGKPPMAGETLAQLHRIKGFKPTISRIRAALDKLKRAGVMTRTRGSYRIEDRLFAEHLATLAIGREL